jgi:hypothetical protein
MPVCVALLVSLLKLGGTYSQWWFAVKSAKIQCRRVNIHN